MDDGMGSIVSGCDLVLDNWKWLVNLSSNVIYQWLIHS